MPRRPATRRPGTPQGAGSPGGDPRRRRSPAAGGAAGGEDPLPPAIAGDGCHLLATLLALVRMHRLAGRSVAEIATTCGIPQGSLRHWTYAATSGDAVALERAIGLLGGAEISIEPRQPRP